MEEVLEVYQQPYDAQRPQVCMDEMPKQLLRDKYPPTLPHPGHPATQDYQSEAQATCNLFMFFEPVTGQRQVLTTARRTAVDWAQALKTLADVYYPHAERIILVLDNLNTHRFASLYKAFPPAEAQRLRQRFELHYTPRHGSWLNMAEIELSALERQCLARRLPTAAALDTEVQAWVTERNAAQVAVDWRFTTADARIKLKHLYPNYPAIHA